MNEDDTIPSHILSSQCLSRKSIPVPPLSIKRTPHSHILSRSLLHFFFRPYSLPLSESFKYLSLSLTLSLQLFLSRSRSKSQSKYLSLTSLSKNILVVLYASNLSSKFFLRDSLLKQYSRCDSSFVCRCIEAILRTKTSLALNLLVIRVWKTIVTGRTFC